MEIHKFTMPHSVEFRWSIKDNYNPRAGAELALTHHTFHPELLWSCNHSVKPYVIAFGIPKGFKWNLFFTSKFRYIQVSFLFQEILLSRYENCFNSVTSFLSLVVATSGPRHGRSTISFDEMPLKGQNTLLAAFRTTEIIKRTFASKHQAWKPQENVIYAHVWNFMCIFSSILYGNQPNLQPKYLVSPENTRRFSGTLFFKTPSAWCFESHSIPAQRPSFRCFCPVVSCEATIPFHFKLLYIGSTPHPVTVALY